VEFAGRMPEIGSDRRCVTWKMCWPDSTPLPHHQCPMAVEGHAVAQQPRVTWGAACSFFLKQRTGPGIFYVT
jgi:hypothetical protein